MKEGFIARKELLSAGYDEIEQWTENSIKDAFKKVAYIFALVFALVHFLIPQTFKRK